MGLVTTVAHCDHLIVVCADYTPMQQTEFKHHPNFDKKYAQTQIIYAQHTPNTMHSILTLIKSSAESWLYSKQPCYTAIRNNLCTLGTDARWELWSHPTALSTQHVTDAAVLAWLCTMVPSYHYMWHWSKLPSDKVVLNRAYGGGAVLPYCTKRSDFHIRRSG